MSLNISCSRCKRRLVLPPSVVGRLVQCPNCRNTFTAQPPKDDAEEPASPQSDDIPVLQPIVEELEAVPTLTAVDDDDAPPARNAWQRAQRERERRPRPSTLRPRRVKTFTFDAAVRADSEGKLSGWYTAELCEDGLHLCRNGRDVLLVPRGGPAEHLGGSKLAVTVSGRRVEMDVSCGFGPRTKLAHDLAAHLMGGLADFKPHRYRVPKGFVFFGLTPLVLAAGFLGSLPWMAAGAGLAALCVLIAFLRAWPAGLRLGFIITACVGSLIALPVGLIFNAFFGPLDLSKWKTFQPPGSRCVVQMPGTPSSKSQNIPGGGLMVMHMVEDRIRGHAFVVAVIPIQDAQDRPLKQRFADAREGMLRNMPGARLTGEREIEFEGYPGSEYLFNYQGKGTLVFRLYAAENQLYILGAGGNGYTRATPALVKFFGSFQFTDDPRRWLPQTARPGFNPDARGTTRLVAKGQHQVHAAAFSPDGAFLAVGEGDRFACQHLVLWDVQNQKIHMSFLNQLPIRSVQAVAFSPDGRLLAAGTDTGKVHLWDWPSGKEGPALAGHQQAVTGLAFSPDGKTLASASTDALKLWNTETRQETAGQARDWRMPDRGQRAILAFRPDGKALVTAGGGREIVFRDPRTGAAGVRREYPHHAGPSALAFSADGKLLAAGGADGSVLPYRGEDGEPITSANPTFPQFRNHAPLVTVPGTPIHSLAFRKDGLLAIGGENQLVLADPGKRQRVQALPEVRRVSGLSFNSTRQTLAASSLDGNTFLIDVAPYARPEPFKIEPPPPTVPSVVKPDDPRQKSRLVIPNRSIVAFDLTQDGRTAVTLDSQGELRSWDIPGSRSEVLAAGKWAGGPARLRFSRDGKLLFFADRLQARIWDVQAKKFMAGTVLVKRDLAVSPECHRLAIVDDRGLLQYDPRDGTEIGGEKGRLPGFSPAAYGADGTIAARGANSTIEVWDGNGKSLGVLTGQFSAPTALVLAGDPVILLSCSGDNMVHCWKAGGGLLWRCLVSPTPTCLAVTPDGVRGAAGCTNGRVHFLMLSPGRSQGFLQAANEPIHSVAFAESGRSVAVVSGGTATVWETSRVLGTIVDISPAQARPPDPPKQIVQPASILRGGQGTLRHLAASPEGKHIAAVWTQSDMGMTRLTVALWDENNRPVPLVFPEGFKPLLGAVAFSADSAKLYMLGRAEVLVWSITGGKPAARFALPKEDAQNRLLSVSPDGKWLALMRPREVLVFRTEGSVEPVTITPAGLARAVAFGPKDGQVTVVTMLGKVVHRVYEGGTGKELVLEKREGPTASTSRARSDGRFAVVTGQDLSLWVWDGATNSTWTFPPSTLHSVPNTSAVSPDGKRLVLAHADGQVTIVDLAASKMLGRVLLHTGPLSPLLLTSDGKQLLTHAIGSGPVEIRRWDMEKLERAAK